MPFAREPGRILLAPDGRVRLGWRLLLFVLLTLAVAGAAGALLPAGLLTQSLALLVGAVTAGALVLSLDGRKASALGFHLHPSAVAESAAGLALGTAVAGLVVAAIAVLGGLAWSSQSGTLAAWLVGSAGALAFLAVPAAAEEALLRGYPLQALAEAWGPWSALLVTSGFFALAHLWNPGVTAIATLNVAAAGLFLGIVYLRTASLWWATGAHLGWNWAHGYLADLPVSGLELLDAPFYEGAARGPAWLGGGTFGPEGSLVTTAVVGAVCALCWRAGWLAPSQAARAARPLSLREEGAA
jgi:membrane protease YdiL (CAAX protease family)